MSRLAVVLVVAWLVSTGSVVGAAGYALYSFHAPFWAIAVTCYAVGWLCGWVLEQCLAASRISPPPPIRRATEGMP